MSGIKRPTVSRTCASATAVFFGHGHKSLALGPAFPDKVGPHAVLGWVGAIGLRDHESQELSAQSASASEGRSCILHGHRTTTCCLPLGVATIETTLESYKQQNNMFGDDLLVVVAAFPSRSVDVMRFLILLVFVAVGCGGTPVRVPLPAPNPNGCYVMVFDQPGFRGVGDVWNGPGRWASLEGLVRTRPGGWRNQIRSLSVGSTATVTVFTDSGFKGESREFGSNTDDAQLDRALSERIESVQLTCRQ